MITVTKKEAAELLLSHDDIIVLMHRSPDGDAVGSAYALCAALRSLGKRAQPLCSDPIPKKYSYLTDALPEQKFEPRYIVSVDLAAPQLFGEKLSVYADKVDLCIDHHGSNTGFAKAGFVDAGAGACAQILPEIIEGMGAELDPYMADGIFTGISTDTGCFVFSNAKADSFRIAADMIDKGARSAMINRLMFDTKSKGRLELERMALESLAYFCDGRIAVITLTLEMMEKSGAEESDTEGIASIPRQIEGVQVGVTIKEKEKGYFRMSVRTTDDVDASKICARLGGGGHRAASGCSFHGGADEARDAIIQAAAKALEE